MGQPCVTVMMMDCCRVFKYMDASTQVKPTDTVITSAASLASINEASKEMHRTVFIFGCRPNDTVSDKGLLTKFLKKHLAEANVDIQESLRRVAKEVYDESGGEQTVTINHSLHEQVCLF